MRWLWGQPEGSSFPVARCRACRSLLTRFALAFARLNTRKNNACYAPSSQPRPQGFSLFPPHPFFKGKALGTRLPSSAFRRTPWRIFHHVCRQISFIRQISPAKQPRVIFTGWYPTSFIFNAQGLSPWTFSSVWEPCDGLGPMTIVEAGTTYSPWRDIFLLWKTETFPSSVCVHSIAQTCQNPWLAIKVFTPNRQNLRFRSDIIMVANSKVCLLLPLNLATVNCHSSFASHI